MSLNLRKCLENRQICKIYEIRCTFEKIAGKFIGIEKIRYKSRDVAKNDYYLK